MSTVRATNFQNAGSANVNMTLDTSGNAIFAGMVDPGYSFMRNKIINGDMRIDQRNAGASVTMGVSSVYGVDRWQSNEDTDGTMTVQQSTTSPPSGFTHSMLFTTTVADASLAATQYTVTQQKIEGLNTSDLGWGAAGALPITVSFWARSSLTGNHSGAVQNNDQNRSYPFIYTISAANTWEYKTVTIPGDTSGTWLTTNGPGMRLVFDLGSGSNFRGTAGAWAASAAWGVTGAVSVISTLGATWQITGVQLESGTIATPFERRLYGQELALCQRYYYAVGSLRSTVYADSVVSDGNFPYMFPVTMRAAPTVTATTGGTTLANTGTQSAMQVTTSGFQWNVLSSSAAGMRGSTSNSYTASAEL